MKREDFFLFSFIVLICFLSFSPLNRSDEPIPAKAEETIALDTATQVPTANASATAGRQVLLP